MDLNRAHEFLRQHHRAILLTRHADGRPQLSPVTCGVDPQGRVVVSTRATAVKTRNIEHDPRVHLCAMTDAFFGDWLQIDGQANILRLPEAMQSLVEYYRAISGEHPDWDDYRAAMQRDRRVLLQISITGVGPTFHG